MIAHLKGCTQQEESVPWVAYPVWCIHMFLFTPKSLPLPQLHLKDPIVMLV